MRKLYILSIMVFLVFFSPFTLQAQEGINTTDIESCFVYYDYGKVKTNLATDKGTYSPGERAKVQGVLVNNNKFPLLGVSLYAHLARVNTGEDFIKNGHFLVDRLMLLSDINLLQGEMRAIDFNLPIKNSYPNGDYELQYFVFSKEGFHYSGRPFLEEDNAGTSSLKITGAADREVFFDPSSLTVDESPHYVRESISEFPDKPLLLAVSLSDKRTNKTAIPAEIKIYSFDDSNENNLISSNNILLKPFNQFLAQTTFTPPYPGAYVFLIQIDAPQKSVFKYRFAVKGDWAFRLKMNDLGVLGFPPEKDGRAFVCFHSPTNNNAPQTQVKLSLLDSQKNTVDSKAVSDTFDSSVQAISLPTEKLINHDDFWVKAEFTSQDNPRDVQTVERHYSCDIFSRSVKDIDMTYDEKNARLKIKNVDVCGREIPTGGFIEELKLNDQSENLVREGYNLSSDNIESYLKDLPTGKYTAKLKSGDITRTLDFTVSVHGSLSAQKNAKMNIVTRLIIIAVFLFIFIIIGLLYFIKKRKLT